MKPSVFARPNLKVFLLGAVIIVAVQHVICNGLSQGSPSVHGFMTVHAREPVDAHMQEILDLTGKLPPSQIYARLSDYYEDRGDFRKALRYLRLATMVAESEELE